MTNLANNSKGYFVEPGLLGARLDASYYTPDAIQAEQRLVTGEQSGNFNVQPLEDICSYIMDFQAFSIYNFVEFSETYKDGWIEFLRVQDLNRGFVDTEKVLWTSPQSHELMKKSVVQPGDILLSIIGTLGVATRWTKGHECNSNQCIAKIRLKPQYDPGYLVAALNSQTMQILIHRDATGTVQKGLSLGGTRRLRLPLPDPKIQAYIGDKVRLAERCREEANRCESQSTKILFDLLGWPINFLHEQSHFVDPGIVSDRLDPKYYQVKYLQTIQHIRNHANGYVLLDNLVESVSNGSEYREYTNEGMPYLTVGDISGGRLLWKKAPRIPLSAPISARGRLDVHDVLVVRTGSIGQAAFVHHACKDAVISSHFIKLRLKSPRQAPWIAFFLNSVVGKILLERIAYGAIQPQIGQDELLQIPIPLIDQKYQKELATLWSRFIFLNELSEDLITEATQDVENLISGKLDISILQVEDQKKITWESIEQRFQDEITEDA